MTISQASIINGQRKLDAEHHRGQKMREYTPEEMRQRKICVVCARDYYVAIEIAVEQLNFADRMRAKPEEIEQEKIRIYRNLLKVVEKCFRSADWSISLFFQGIGNRIRAMRDEIRQTLNEATEFLNPNLDNASSQLRAGMKIVYVSLYQADGNNFNKWQALLTNITRLSIGRPVYESERDIQAVIRAKAEPRRDAYVALYVREEDIIPPLGGIHPRDRSGNQLLTIREGAIKPENIHEFIHNNGVTVTHYKFEKNKLCPK
ncbi:MAG: Dot/Icm secretion system protein IcmQ [Legionellales bacterium]|nr:Dot/Icm secretion system protein IcmQ [Legionellales bacterium]